MSSNLTKRQREVALDNLRDLLKPGDTVYTILRHVSASGMQRRIDLYTIRDNRPLYLSWAAAAVLDMRLHTNGGIVAKGCGMDMGFSLVYNLGAALWPDGTPEPHGTRNGLPDTCGGYALNHEWI